MINEVLSFVFLPEGSFFKFIDDPPQGTKEKALSLIDNFTVVVF